MRYIDFSLIDENDPDVKEWITKAKTRLRTLRKKTTHEERAEYFRTANIWSKFKPILIKYYGEKCWYSECSLEGSFGDVDHFRPKNKSVDAEGNTILEDGYWWLAYDYLNYRLSCEKSNRSFGDGGKNDIFPLKPGSVPAIEGNKDDIPVLLDPCVDSDVALIDCNEAGEIISLSSDPYDLERVAISKKVYNWNCFNNARKNVRSKCKTALELFEMMYEKAPENMEPSIESIKELTDTQTPYSSFAKHYIKSKIEGKPYETVLQQLI